MQPIPQPLKIVAWIFIIGGISAAIQVVFLLLAGNININFGVLGIFIGQGLLRLNPRSLAWAMFFTWLGLILTPIFIVMSLFMPSNFEIFGLTLGRAPPVFSFLFSIAAFALVCWQYTVLTKRQIRRLFVL